MGFIAKTSIKRLGSAGFFEQRGYSDWFWKIPCSVAQETDRLPRLPLPELKQPRY